MIASSQQEVLKHLSAGEKGVGVELLYRASFAREANKHSAAAVSTYTANGAGGAALASPSASSSSALPFSAAGSGSGSGSGGGGGGVSSEYIVLMLKEVEKRLEVLLGVVQHLPAALKKAAIKMVEDQKGAERRTAALQKNHEDEAARKRFYAQRAQMEVFKPVRRRRRRRRRRRHRHTWAHLCCVVVVVLLCRPANRLWCVRIL